MTRHAWWMLPLALVTAGLLVGCDGDIQPLAPEFRASSGSGSGPTPTAPSNANAVAPSFDQINVSWQDNSSNESGFEVHRSITGPSGPFTLLATTGANATTYGNGGLSGSMQYCYKIRAFRTLGGKTNYSAFSNGVCATTLAPPVPAAPSGALAAPQFFGTEIGITWKDNSSDETGFRVERSVTTGRPWTSVGTTSANASALNDFQVPAPDQSVCYRVIAFNGYGDSQASNVVCTAVPAAPTNLVASTSGSNVDLTWTDNSAVEGGYAVYRWTAWNPSTLIATLAANATSYHDAGLADSTYWYQVRVLKDGGEGSASNNASVLVETVPPSTPGDVAAVPQSSSAIMFSWTATSANAAGFRVERSTDGGTNWVAYQTMAGSDSYLWDSGLAPEQQLCYRITAFNSLGESAPSNAACTAPPAAPTDFSATPVDASTIDFAWTDNSNVEDGYAIGIDYGFGYWEIIAVVGPNVTSYRLQSGSAYYNTYFVAAMKDGGFSDWSNEVYVTPTAASAVSASLTRPPTAPRLPSRTRTLKPARAKP